MIHQQYTREDIMKKYASIAMILFLCCSLCGCEHWQEEDGTSHFMLWGERGPMKDGKPMSEEESSALNQDTSTKANSPEIEASPKSTQNNTIQGMNLKKGWTSDDPSILKGSHVSVTGSTELLSISMIENKEVTIHMNAALDQGEYQVVIIFPDQSQSILYDTLSKSESETITLKAGANSIWLLSEAVTFKSIDLSIDGLEPSNFSN